MSRPTTTPRSFVLGGSFTGPPPSSGFSAWLTDLGARLTGHALPDFLPEDRAICERGQRGARGTFRPGKLVALERVLVDFHRYLAWRLLGTEPRPSDLEAPGS